jgi:hypothetical protein
MVFHPFGRLLIPGIYRDGAARTLAGATINADDMTNDKCVAYCASNNYIYAATEYSRVSGPASVLKRPGTDNVNRSAVSCIFEYSASHADVSTLLIEC